MNDDYNVHREYMQIRKAEVVRLLLESKAREAALAFKLGKLEEDFCRKTSNCDLAIHRESELKKMNESLVNQRTNALMEAERERNSNIALRKEADHQKTLREQAERHAADLRKMVDLLTLVAGRE